MKNTTFVASTDFALQVEGGEVEFKKGDLVCLEVDEKDDPFISYHEEAEDGTIHEVEIDITSIQVFEGILENVVCLEEEFENKVSFEEMTIDQLLFEEGISLDVLTCYLAEASKRLVRKGRNVVTRKGKKVVLAPVNRRKIKQTPKQRAALKVNRRKAQRSGAKRIRAKSMAKTRKARGGSLRRECEFFVQTDLLLNETAEFASKYTQDSLQSYFGEHATVNVNNDNDIMVDLKAQNADSLIEALEQADVSYVLEGEGQVRKVVLVAPEDEPVVESYYAEKTCSEKAKEMLSKMETKLKEMEGDDEVDMESMKSMLDAYKSKMEQLGSCDDEEKALAEMEGDYHKFIKAVPSKKSSSKEAKMTDEAVKKAAKAMVDNSEDAKVKKFAQGILDFHKKEGSFTPDQVAGLQNIMKNASFHMADKDD